jgi:transcriptional regulator with XRE-family HTH domain
MLRCHFVRLNQRRTQRAVARKATISNSILCLIERGRIVPTDRELKSIAKALDWMDDPARLLDEVQS